MSKPSSHFIIRYSASDWVSLTGLCLSCIALWVIVSTQEASMLALGVITASMLCDAYDGWVARKTQVLRPFGAYFDTNIDIMTHLLVPLLWFYHWGFDQPYQLLIMLLVFVSGLTRLAVFNEKGFVQDESVSNGRAYWGVPVFWCPIWIACFVVLAEILTPLLVEALASIVLVGFAYSMVRPKASYKPTNIYWITCILAIAIAICWSWPWIPASVWQHLQLTVCMTIPLWMASHLHLLFSKTNTLAFLNKPIHQACFGQNKTWRGVCCVIVGSALSMSFIQWLGLEHIFLQLPLDFSSVNSWLLGASIGAAFVVGELPNSYIKRRLGISPGQLPTGKKIWCIVGDQIDSAWCVALVYAIFFGFTYSTTLLLFITLPITFFFFRVYFFVIGLKASPIR